MTDMRMALAQLLEKGSDADLLREMVRLAPPGVPAQRLTASRLDRAVDATLKLPPSPRREAASRLKGSGGVQRAVALLESIARSQ